MEFKCLTWRLRSLLSPLSSLVSPPPPSPSCPLSSWFLTSVVLSLRVMLLWFQHKFPKKNVTLKTWTSKTPPKTKRKFCFPPSVLLFSPSFPSPSIPSLFFLPLLWLLSLRVIRLCFSINWLKKSHSKFDPPKNSFVLSSLLSLPSFFSSSFSLSFFHIFLEKFVPPANTTFWKSLFHQFVSPRG